MTFELAYKLAYRIAPTRVGTVKYWDWRYFSMSDAVRSRYIKSIGDHTALSLGIL